MTIPSQRHVFVEGEGEVLFQYYSQFDADQISNCSLRDLLVSVLENLSLPSGSETTVFELGCGQGFGMAHLNPSNGWCVASMDPRQKAISAKVLRKHGLFASKTNV